MITFSNETIGALEFTVTWEKDGVTHEEWFLGRKFNAVNDIFPRGMRDALEGKAVGESVTFTYEPRMCIPRHKESQLYTFDQDRFRRRSIAGRDIYPRLGRFYPQGLIYYMRNNNADNLTPFRLVGIDEKTFTADLNHPLANIPVTISAKVNYLGKREVGTYGSLTHWREKTCDWGPGMQAKLNGLSADFFHPDFFKQIDTSDSPIQPPDIDEKAINNFKQTYAKYLKPGMRVLDLSSRPATSYPDDMNLDVVSYNPLITLQGDFDAIIATQSIEYSIEPVALLKTVSEHLKQNGVMLIGFSSNWLPNKVIQGWVDMHEFERLALILEYMNQAGLTGKSGTHTIRNDWRPKDDPLFLETRGASDPVYIAWSYKE